MHKISKRFRGLLPVVVDVETGALDPSNAALLEVAAVTIKMDEHGIIHPDRTYHYHILPFPGTLLDPKALEFTKIDPTYPLRFAVEEKEAMKDMYEAISKECKAKSCERAILVGHNSWFDQQAINAACQRNDVQRPFHRFTSLDTATLAGLIFGQTVLPKALEAAKIPYNVNEAHSALYDATCTAELFCYMVNRFKSLGGWPV